MIDGGRSEEERRAWSSWLRPSIAGTRSARLNWNQSLQRDPEIKGGSFPALRNGTLKCLKGMWLCLVWGRGRGSTRLRVGIVAYSPRVGVGAPPLMNLESLEAEQKN